MTPGPMVDFLMHSSDNLKEHFFNTLTEQQCYPAINSHIVNHLFQELHIPTVEIIVYFHSFGNCLWICFHGYSSENYKVGFDQGFSRSFTRDG